MPDSKPKDASSENICKEMGSHGAKWATVHGSYFSDLSIAAPLVNAIRKAADVHSPDVIADIGGGTGFLLSEIGAKLMNKKIKLIECRYLERADRHKQGTYDLLDTVLSK